MLFFSLSIVSISNVPRSFVLIICLDTKTYSSLCSHADPRRRQHAKFIFMQFGIAIEIFCHGIDVFYHERAIPVNHNFLAPGPLKIGTLKKRRRSDCVAAKRTRLRIKNDRNRRAHDGGSCFCCAEDRTAAESGVVPLLSTLLWTIGVQLARRNNKANTRIPERHRAVSRKKAPSRLAWGVAGGK